MNPNNNEIDAPSPEMTEDGGQGTDGIRISPPSSVLRPSRERRRGVTALAAACVLTTVAAPGLAQPGAAAHPEASLPQSEMRGTIERFTAAQTTIERSFTVEISPERAERLRQLYGDSLEALQRVDFGRLSQEGRIDYLLFRNYLQHALRELDIQARRREEEGPLVPFALTIIGLEDARRRMEPLDSEKAAATLHALAKEIEATRNGLEGEKGRRGEGETENAPAGDSVRPPSSIIGHPSKSLALRAAKTVDALRTTLRNWHGFYNGYDPQFTWWAHEAYREVDKQLEGYHTFLREHVAGVKPGDESDIVGDPIGREALLSELAYEMIPYTPEELIRIANQEYAWCEKEMKRASRDLGYGDDWKKALEHVKQDHVPPGRQPELIKQLALEAIDFVERHDLVTVPPLAKESWHMEMMSPERQLVNPFFLGGENIIVSYPTDSMTYEQKLMSMRGNNRSFARATVFHELIPGHHLQWYMQARYRTYRRPFHTPFWVEGNALYWEMLFWDLGFPQTPEERIGMLFWRMHRCARIIFSLGFHLGQMTPEQCIDLLVDRVGHERANAEGEVRRSLNGDYPPLYQCAYMLGGLQLRALHRELVDSGKMTVRQFNDAVLKENAIPIEMIRADLTRQKLSRDYTAHWRFYDGTDKP